MKKLILIRHGETDYTLQRRYCGHEDIPLNARGIEQANYLRYKLKNIKVDRVYSSDLKRTFQTAKIIFQNKIIYKRKKLREIDFGVFSGLTFEDVNRLYHDVYKAWLDNPANVKIPEGESLPGFVRRVEKSINEIFNQNMKKTVALVSHGGTIRVILLKMLRQDLDKFWNIQQDSTALNIIGFKNGIPEIIKINDTSHLKEIASAEVSTSQ